MRSKTFRIFISSTFIDFQEERIALQKRVFPNIIEYCKEWGYSFQPIDLRWGISHEAQLDQKTVELCLNEVKACKSYPYPNFLIMIGNRYGWVPVPYAIEKSEFERLILKMTNAERELIHEWYVEDKNQIPTSYILLERKHQYCEADKWQNVEDQLKNIFQEAVAKSSLNDKDKAKYFLSVTEAEIMTGVKEYVRTLNPPSNLNEPNIDLEKDHIFGFFRDIETESISSTKFQGADCDQAEIFKTRVQKTLPKSNQLSITTRQLTDEKLDVNYIEKFVTSTFEFLKSKIDRHIKESIEKKQTPLDLEKEGQYFFKKQRIKNFQGYVTCIEKIKNYINGFSTQPLIIYGASGRGKTTLMAQAIEMAEKLSKSQVVYRFVGATPLADNSNDLLTSICQQLKFNLPNKDQHEISNASIGRSNAKDSFYEFSKQVYSKILSIQNPTIIFIDAVDQLVNNDRFDWLPQKLPKEVKIIISALDDPNYSVDSQYFLNLKERTQNLLEIPHFEEPLPLLESLLTAKNRKLQPTQQKYFLKQYKKVKTPLYLVIAAESLSHWKSYDIVDNNDIQTLHGSLKNLPDSISGIVLHYIESLHLLYHHDKKLVQKIIGHIYTSFEGLSEKEILTLIAQDVSLIHHLVGKKKADQDSIDLPIVFWSRLSNMLRPFLGVRSRNGQQIFYFYHREYRQVISNFPNIESLHSDLIHDLISVVKARISEKFMDNSWGYILSSAFFLFEKNHETSLSLKNRYVELSSIDNESWMQHFFILIKNNGLRFARIELITSAIISYRTIIKLAELLFEQPLGEKWNWFYIKALLYSGVNYSKIKNRKKALELEEIAHGRLLRLHENYPDKYWQDLSNIKSNMAIGYDNTGYPKKALRFASEATELRKFRYKNNPKNFELASLYCRSLRSLAYRFSEEVRREKALEQAKKAHEILSSFLESNLQKDHFEYLNSLSCLIDMHYKNGERDKALVVVSQALNIVEIRFEQNPDEWIDTYSSFINQYLLNINTKKNQKEYLKASYEILDLVKKYYQRDPERWALKYMNILGSLAFTYSIANKDFEKAEEFYLEIFRTVSPLYENRPELWTDKYLHSLNSLANLDKERGNTELAIKKFQEIVDKINQLYQEDSNKWAEQYLNVLLFYRGCFMFNSDSRCLPFNQKGVEIANGIYRKNPNKFAEIYIRELRSLASTYRKMDKLVLCARYESISLEVALRHYNKGQSGFMIIEIVMKANNLLDLYAEIYSKRKKLMSDEIGQVCVKTFQITKDYYDQDPKKNFVYFLQMLKYSVFFGIYIGEYRNVWPMADEGIKMIEESESYYFWLEDFLQSAIIITTKLNLAEQTKIYQKKLVGFQSSKKYKK